MIIRKSFARILLPFLYLILCSHEFWISPDKFIFKRGEKISIRFFVGENFEGDIWNGNNERIQSLNLYYGGVSDDLTKQLSNENGDSLELIMLDEGSCMIALNSNNAFIELEAQEFNNYLLDEGLNEVLDFRKQNNEMDSAGKEYYQRCAKTLFKIGEVKDKTFSVITNLVLEIIPLDNPYLLKDNDSLSFQILFNKVPLPGSLVKIWNRYKDSTYISQHITDKNGELKIPVSINGKWMISTVKMKRLQSDPVGLIFNGWQSYWGSFTWGYE